MKPLRALSAACLLCVFGNTALAASDPAAPVLSEQQKRLAENQRAQKKVDQVFLSTGEMVTEYQTKLKIVDGLKVYNALLAKQHELVR